MRSGRVLIIWGRLIDRQRAFLGAFFQGPLYLIPSIVHAIEETHVIIRRSCAARYNRKHMQREQSLGYATKTIFPSLPGKLSRFSDRDNYSSIIQPPDLSFIYTDTVRNVSITQKYISLKAAYHPSYYPGSLPNPQTLGPNLA
jgi:hypothetical protein